MILFGPRRVLKGWQRELINLGEADAKTIFDAVSVGRFSNSELAIWLVAGAEATVAALLLVADILTSAEQAVAVGS